MKHDPAAWQAAQRRVARSLGIEQSLQRRGAVPDVGFEQANSVVPGRVGHPDASSANSARNPSVGAYSQVGR